MADASYDLLVLDAFSSDAIPTHLLTLEALTDDRRVVRPDGLIAIHVSNRYYDLAPAIGAAGSAPGDDGPPAALCPDRCGSPGRRLALGLGRR